MKKKDAIDALEELVEDLQMELQEKDVMIDELERIISLLFKIIGKGGKA